MPEMYYTGAKYNNSFLGNSVACIPENRYIYFLFLVFMYAFLNKREQSKPFY